MAVLAHFYTIQFTPSILFTPISLPQCVLNQGVDSHRQAATVPSPKPPAAIKRSYLHRPFSSYPLQQAMTRWPNTTLLTRRAQIREQHIALNYTILFTSSILGVTHLLSYTRILSYQGILSYSQVITGRYMGSEDLPLKSDCCG